MGQIPSPVKAEASIVQRTRGSGRSRGRIRAIVASVIPLGMAGGVLALQGTAMYAPLAWVIIGGLIASTLLARIVTPVMYTRIAPQVEPAETAPASASGVDLEPATTSGATDSSSGRSALDDRGDRCQE